MVIALDSPPLTPRQLEVLELMAKGLVNREIAEVLGIAPATVKRHVSAVIEALDVTNRTEAATALHELGLGRAGSAPGSQQVTGFGERPAIAVLPFDNFSPEAEHAFVADGIVEDLTTRLARWRWFPVIARNSTFVYKGQAIDVKEASRALGARFIVEGSVRCAGNRIRITIQLIDGATGQHVLAEHFDRELRDLFAVEDEIVDGLVMTLEPALARIEGMRLASRPPAMLEAWECLGRGFMHLTQNNGEDIRRALEMFEQAQRMDPLLAPAYTGVAMSSILDLVWARSSDRARTVASAVEMAERAVGLDPGDAVALSTLGFCQLYQFEPETARHTEERALELNPSLAWAHTAHGISLTALGEADAAAAAVETAVRLSPRDPFLPFFYSILATARTLQGDFAEGLALHERSLRLRPNDPGAYAPLAAAYLWVGQPDESRRVLDRLRDLAPEFQAIEACRPYIDAGSLAAMAEGLASVGYADPAP